MEGDNGGFANALTMTVITTGLTNLGTVFTSSISVITGSVPMMIFLAGGLIMLGFRIFKRGKIAIR